MKPIASDLHIHTCLSPCAELDMTPRRIVRRAVEMGLDMIAITDHNSAENVEAAMRAGSGSGVSVLAGMEITSSEEAHVLALFGSAGAALDMQGLVYRGLTGGPAGRDWQVVVNEDDEVIGFNRRLLIGATALPLRALVEEIRRRGGLAVASHVDRGAFSVSSQMGFVPEDLVFDAFEVIDPAKAAPALAFHPGVSRLAFSDAHRIEDIGSRTTSFMMKEAGFGELSMALRGEGGRSLRGR